MFTMKLAGHIFTVDNRYPYIERLCRDYLTDEPPEGSIAVTQEDILFENRQGGGWSDGYLESLAVYRKLCTRLLEDDIVLFHCSALEMDGRAYLFTAPSGTGKSTHARLWREKFGDRVVMINDDKPLLAVRKDGITVYGTPYSGKERLQTNRSAPVAGIVILHQAQKNEARRLLPKEAYPTLFKQTYRRKDPAGLVKTMDLVRELSELPVFSLGCTISMEAVELIYSRLKEVDG